MNVYKLTFYREMLCTVEIPASCEITARDLFNENHFDQDLIEIVKEAEVIDEIASIEEILPVKRNALPN